MLLIGSLVAGCESAKEPEPAPSQVGSTAASELAGTVWRLIEFQSMDDAIGTVRPDDPSLYTMRLDADGTVSMTLNCNSATGAWTAEPGPDRTNGRFEFGPLAATAAVCPPPSMDERITADAAFVRGYLLKDGRLYLSLMADAGIYAWEPQAPGPPTGAQGAVPFEATPAAEIEAEILSASPDDTRETVEILGIEARYVYSRGDVNGDGTEEVFVYLMGSVFCGSGGCVDLERPS